MDTVIMYPATTTSSRIRRLLIAILPPVIVAVGFLAVLRVFSLQPLAALVGAAPLQLLSVAPSKFVCNARSGELAHASVTVRNLSSESVTLMGAQSSCGCTTVLDKFPVELRSRATTTVEADVHVGAPDANGEFVRQVNLYVNRGGAVPPLIVEVTVIGLASPP
jgi:hypothetical protein